MREIKFRGRFVKDDLSNEYIGEDEMIYGGYVKMEGKDYIIPIDMALEVKPGSVAQLIGVDKNGVEVYEGDSVRNPVDGTVFKAAMNHIYTVKSYELVKNLE